MKVFAWPQHVFQGSLTFRRRRCLGYICLGLVLALTLSSTLPRPSCFAFTAPKILAPSRASRGARTGLKCAGSTDAKTGMDGVADVTGSIVLLNIVTMLFGSNQVLIKTLEADEAIDGYLCMFLRFAIAALALGAVSAVGHWKDRDKSPDPSTVAPGDSSLMSLISSGTELSVWLFLGFLLQAVGLQYTTASSGALLGSLTMVLVPLLSALDGRKVAGLTWGSVGLACMGTCLLVGPGALTGDLGSVGDLLELGSAALFAIQLWRCERLIRQVPESQIVGLTCLQLILVALFSFICLLGEGFSVASVIQTVEGLPATEWMQIAVMGLVTTAFCLWAEARALRDVDATPAALIYACEPIWGALFAFLWMGDTLNGPFALCGASLLLLASFAGVVASMQTDAGQVEGASQIA
eukprot:TRINITY_DN28954_c0_g1_i1.p1 TRINITY_DN28954_c0_g1~~TRINITY_DN28954_c0_g1_i1.p1  ORF type:complete len:410 (-),score=62.16 TRINITY_DN28954_c0_g1_i1:389-1618(-)